MTEMVKSGIFAGIALVMLVVGYFARPATEILPPQPDSGEPFWEQFDPLDIGRMRIVTFDADASEADTFEVAKTPDGGWLINSHDKYPTDVEDKLADATVAVIDLVKGTIASESKRDHSELGVVAPSEFTPGTTGVGTRITLEDENGDKLADIIVGKKDAGPDAVDDPFRPSNDGDIRFVREFGQDRVYRAKLDLDKLSTKFEDWIETDLLQLDSQKIKQVLIDNYSLQVVLDQRAGRMRLTIDQVEKLLLSYNKKDSKWGIRQLLFNDEKRDFVEHPFDEVNDELNEEKLNGMRTALNDLKIVDVRRKPDVVSANLRVEGEMTRDVAEAMLAAGFLANPDGEVFSKQGDVIVGMDDGVEYVLRFGEVKEARGGKELKDDSEDEELKLEDLTRYLMVSARFNQKLIPPPELQPLPNVADQPAPAKEKPEPKTDDDKQSDAPESCQDEQAEQDEAAKDKAADESKEKAGEDKAGEDKAPAKKEPAKKEAEPKAPPKQAEPKADEPKPNAEPELTPEQVARKKIEEANKKKQDEYDELVKKGQERAQKLNRRFADWYYIISDEEFKKIRLRREDIIKHKDAKGAGDLPLNFDELKKGLKLPPKKDGQ